MRHVVVAVVVRNRRLLMTQRSETGSFPLLWELMGGKVVHGEILEDALERELVEELGVRPSEVDVGERLGTVNLDPPVCVEPTRVHLYRVTLLGQPAPVVAAGMGWFTHAELGALAMTPANRAALAMLREEVLR